MILNEKLFYRRTEGYLGDTNNCKLLFLMREPNCGKDQITRDDDFWFRKVVQGEKRSDGRKLAWRDCYLSKLGRIASLALDDNTGETEIEWVSSLKKGIYININPISGKGTKSAEYRKALELFDKGPGIECSLMMNGKNYNYPNRWNVILNMPDNSIIITIGDVFSKMFDWFSNHGEIVSTMKVHLLINTKKGIRSMRSFVYSYDNRTATVLETLHPASRGTNSYQPNGISICRSHT